MPERKVGRPSGYSAEIADRICERIADGESLRAICSDEDMPSTSSVCKWLSLHNEFAEQYARAREAQADALFDDILIIADDGSNDFMERKSADGGVDGWRENGEALRRSALRVDARKWMAGKLAPKKYGDRQEIDLNVNMDPDQAKARLAELLGKAQGGDVSD